MDPQKNLEHAQSAVYKGVIHSLPSNYFRLHEPWTPYSCIRRSNEDHGENDHTLEENELWPKIKYQNKKLLESGSLPDLSTDDSTIHSTPSVCTMFRPYSRVEEWITQCHGISTLAIDQTHHPESRNLTRAGEVIIAGSCGAAPSASGWPDATTFHNYFQALSIDEPWLDDPKEETLMEDIKEITAAESHISTSTVHEQQSFSLFKIQPEPTVLSSLITEEDLSGLLQALRDNVCSSIQAIFIEAPDILVIVPETIHVWDMEGLDRTEAHCEGLTVLCPVQAFALSLGKVKFNWPSATGDGDLDAIIPYLFGRIRREIAGILVSIYTQILIKQGQLVDKYYFLQCGSGPSPAPSRSPHGVDCAPCANCTGQSTRTQTSAGPTSIKMPGKQDNDEYDDDDELRQPSRKKRKLLLSSSFSCPLESNYGCTWSTAEYHRIKSHLLEVHVAAYQCSTCGKRAGTQTGIDEHQVRAARIGGNSCTRRDFLPIAPEVVSLSESIKNTRFSPTQGYGLLLRNFFENYNSSERYESLRPGNRSRNPQESRTTIQEAWRTMQTNFAQRVREESAACFQRITTAWEAEVEHFVQNLIVSSGPRSTTLLMTDNTMTRTPSPNHTNVMYSNRAKSSHTTEIGPSQSRLSKVPTTPAEEHVQLPGPTFIANPTPNSAIMVEVNTTNEASICAQAEQDTQSTNETTVPSLSDCVGSGHQSQNDVLITNAQGSSTSISTPLPVSDTDCFGTGTSSLFTEYLNSLDILEGFSVPMTINPEQGPYGSLLENGKRVYEDGNSETSPPYKF